MGGVSIGDPVNALSTHNRFACSRRLPPSQYKLYDFALMFFRTGSGGHSMAGRHREVADALDFSPEPLRASLLNLGEEDSAAASRASAFVLGYMGDLPSNVSSLRHSGMG